MSLKDLLGSSPNNTVKSAEITQDAFKRPNGGVYTYRLNKARLALNTASKTIDQREGQRELLKKQLEEAKNRKLEAEKALGVYDLVQILLQKTSDYARQQIKTRIEEIVTQALNVVFDKSYKFTVNLEVKANQPIAEYFLESDGVVTQLKPPDYDRGGGVADVVALSLRLAIAELEGTDGPLHLDEVGKHVSAEYAPNVAYFLKEYSRNFQRQIILVTHNTALADIADISIAVTSHGGKAGVKNTY